MSGEDRDTASGFSPGAREAERLLGKAASAAEDARLRLDTMLADLFLSTPGRLSDADRLTMTRLRDGLVGAIEDDLRARLVGLLEGHASAELEAALSSAAVPLAVPRLLSAGVLRDPELVAILLRRAEEHRLTLALRAAAARAASVEPDPAPPLLDLLLRDPDENIAADAMALLVADSRRFDRIADPVLARTDLPAELQHRLVWRVAAALRDPLTAQGLGEAAADHAIVTAATASLAAYDEGETLEGRAMTLARRLHAAAKLDDALIERAIGDARLALGVAALAVRAGIGFADAWAMFADRGGERLLVLLRAVGIARDCAASIALRLALLSEAYDSVADRISGYEAIDTARARDALRPWRLDAAYRRAIAELQDKAPPA
jgi:hypothetical protein